MPRARAAVLLAGVLGASGGGQDPAAKARLFAPEEKAPPAPFDWSRADAALRMDADEAATRLGSFDWAATVAWTVSRTREPPARIHVLERHRVRQLASGDFEVESDIDPGGGAPGSGKRVIRLDQMTYARSLYAPFGAWRKRPTDRGRDARRFRDESFGVLADVARLCGEGLRLEPAGEGRALGRAARRFRLSLARRQVSAPATPAPPGPSDDADTRPRLEFLEGRVPARVDGEVLADAETGVPLSATIRAGFRMPSDPEARVDVEVATGMRALGPKVPAVVAPKDALPDERKPRGVARALEAAGLKRKAGGVTPEETEPDEGE